MKRKFLNIILDTIRLQELTDNHIVSTSFHMKDTALHRDDILKFINRKGIQYKEFEQKKVIHLYKRRGEFNPNSLPTITIFY